MKSTRVRARLLCLLLCLAVLVPAASALGETTKVAAYLLRLREGPSITAKVLDAYPRGTRVTILKRGANWTRVRVHGKEGYMQTNLLSYARGSSSPGKNSSGSSGSTAYVIKGVRLNLREEANNSSEIIASFRGGTRVTILRRGKYWCRVEVKGLVGYMGTAYLDFDEE